MDLLKTSYAREAILEYLDDLEDLYLAEQQMVEVRAGRLKTIPIEDVMKQYGLSVELTPAAVRDSVSWTGRLRGASWLFCMAGLPFWMIPVALENPGGFQAGRVPKYRVGDYRIISSLDDGTVTVFIVRIGNRREVYWKP